MVILSVFVEKVSYVSQCFQALLDSGAHVDAKDRFGYTALMLAAQKGHDTVVTLLINRGMGNKTDRGRLVHVHFLHNLVGFQASVNFYTIALLSTEVCGFK